MAAALLTAVQARWRSLLLLLLPPQLLAFASSRTRSGNSMPAAWTCKSGRGTARQVTGAGLGCWFVYVGGWVGVGGGRAGCSAALSHTAARGCGVAPAGSKPLPSAPTAAQPGAHRGFARKDASTSSSRTRRKPICRAGASGAGVASVRGATCSTLWRFKAPAWRSSLMRRALGA